MNEYNKKWKIICVMCVFIFFLSLFVFIAPGHIYTVDGGDRYKVTESMVEHYTVSVPPGTGIEGKDGRNYSWYGIGQSILSLPFYYIGKLTSKAFSSIEKSYFTEFMVSFSNIFVGAAICTLIFIFSNFLGISKRVSVILSLIWGICTFAVVHVRDSFELQTTLFALAAFWAIYINSKSGKKIWVAIGGIFIGFNFTTRFASCILIFPIICFLWFIDRKEFRRFAKDVSIFIAFLLPFVIFHLYYNWLRFGSLFESGYANICLGTYGSEIPLTDSYAKSLYGITFSPGRGLFVYSPIFLLGLVAFRWFWAKNRDIAKTFIIAILLYILFYPIFCFWHGSICWGPRYLLPITPLIIIPLGYLIENREIIKGKFMKVSILSLCILSFCIQIPAVCTNYKRYYHYSDAVLGISLQETIYNIRFSPIPGQWKMLFQVIDNVKKGKPWAMAQRVDGFNSQQMIECSKTMNIIHFWYIHLYYMKFPFHLVGGTIMVFLCCFFFSILGLKKIIFGKNKQKRF